MTKTGMLCLICLAATPGLVFCQRSDPGSTRRIALSVQLGPAVGGPASTIADDMRRAGYDDDTPCFFFCSGTISHPSKSRPLLAAGVTVRAALSDYLLLGIGISKVDLGGANGYNSDALDYVFSTWASTVTWANVYWTESGLRLGGGPAVYRLNDFETADKHELTRFGLIGEVGLEFPSNRLLFFDLAIRANLVPSKDVEYYVPDGPALTIRPNWNHVQLLLGGGMRL